MPFRHLAFIRFAVAIFRALTEVVRTGSVASDKQVPLVDDPRAREVKLNGAFTQAYESLKPSSDLDAKAKFTFLMSILLVLVTATSRTQFDVGGVDWKFEHWLLLAVPLGAVVVYAAVQLDHVWKIDRKLFGLKVAASELVPIILEEGIRISEELEEKYKAVAVPGSREEAEEVEAFKRGDKDPAHLRFFRHKNELGEMSELSKRRRQIGYAVPISVASLSLLLLAGYAIDEFVRLF